MRGRPRCCRLARRLASARRGRSPRRRALEVSHRSSASLPTRRRAGSCSGRRRARRDVQAQIARVEIDAEIRAAPLRRKHQFAFGRAALLHIETRLEPQRSAVVFQTESDILNPRSRLLTSSTTSSASTDKTAKRSNGSASSPKTHLLVGASLAGAAAAGGASAALASAALASAGATGLNRREVEELGFAPQDHGHRVAESRAQRPGIVAFADLDLEWIERDLVCRQSAVAVEISATIGSSPRAR